MIKKEIPKDPSLQSKTASGIFWTFLEQFGRRGIGMLVTILLARILTPGDYGLIAVTSVLSAIANAIMDAGFRQALIRKQYITQADYSTIFYANIVLGLFAYGMLFFSAHAIASFYSESKIVLLLRVVGLVVVVNSLQVVQIVDLTRKLDFKTQFKVTISASVVSGISAIIMAMFGAGVWSLVAQMLISTTLITISLWKKNSWRPTREFSLSSFKELFGFGSKIFFSGIIDIIFQNIYVIVISKIFSSIITGYYFFAVNLRDIVLGQLCVSIQRATFPALASLQNDPQRLKNAYRKVMQATTYVVFPAMVFLGTMADPIFSLLLNEKWLPAVPELQLLCISGLIYPLHVVNLNILQVKGRSDLFLYLEITKKILVVFVLAITSQLGITAILLGQIFTSFIAYIPNSYFSKKLIDYSVSEQIRDTYPSFVASVVGGGAAVFISIITKSTKNLQISFMLQISIACFIYFFVSKIMKVGIQETITSIFIDKILKPSLKKRS